MAPPIGLTKVTSGVRTLGTDEVTADIIKDDVVTNAKIKSDAAIAQSKLAEVTAGDLASTLDLSSKTVTLAAGAVTPHVPEYDDNALKEDIALLGFRAASTGSLAKYNLVDQTIDAFQDATGVDAGASTGETRDGTGKYYSGKTTTSSTTGFTVTGSQQIFTVPAGVSSLEIKCFAASPGSYNNGGFSKGNLVTSASTQYTVVVGEVKTATGGAWNDYSYGGGGRAYGYQTGGGLSGVFTGTADPSFTSSSDQARIIIAAGGGGARGHQGTAREGDGGGASGTSGKGSNGSTPWGIGGTQSAAGAGGGNGASGNVMRGGQSNGSDQEAAGGGGYYGGGGGGQAGGSGGGSGYVGTQNNLTAGLTYVGASSEKTSDPDYPGAGVAKVLFNYGVLTENDMTLISNSTTAQAIPTKGDLVMTYSDGAGTATINTDLKAYASRDNGTTWTQLTLASQGSTGAHTILSAHDLDISGQPSGTAMRYKITTHNQSATKETRVHAVSLGWS